MTHYQDLSPKEIGLALNIGPSDISGHLKAGRKQIRKKLGLDLEHFQILVVLLSLIIKELS